MQGAGIQVGHLPGRVARLQHGAHGPEKRWRRALDRVSFGSLLHVFRHKSDAVTAVSDVDLESSVEMIQGIDSKQNTDLKVSHLSNNHFVWTAT